MIRLVGSICVSAVVLVAAMAASGSAGSSASGRLIAYSSLTGKHFDIYVVRTDGTGRRQLTRGSEDEGCPKWSPDAKRLAVGILAARGSWIGVLSASGQEQWRMAAAGCPSWSPDGRHIAFVRLKANDDNVADLYVVGADGRGLRKVARGVDRRAGISGPAWSPDGREIANGDVDGYGDEKLNIVVTRVDGSGRRLLRAKPVPPWCAADESCRFYAGGMAWAPASDIAPIIAVGDLYPEKLYAVHPDGSRLRLLSGKLNDIYGPAWTADGKRIAFWSRPDGQVWTANADGSRLRQLTRVNAKVGCAQPVWASDGRQLACSGSDGRIYIVDAGSGRTRVLVRRTASFTASAPPGNPIAWQP